MSYDAVEIVETKYAGRGLVAAKDIEAGKVLFVAPTIRVPRTQYEEHCKFTVFEDYLFIGRSGDAHLALALGSIFNHSKHPNILWNLDEEQDKITYKSFYAVKKGEPLTISYGPWGKQYESPSDEDSNHSSDDDGKDGLHSIFLEDHT